MGAKRNLIGVVLYINAGHGSLDEQGNYKTFPEDGKRYTFTDENGGIITNAYEGVTNRIFSKLAANEAIKLGAEVITIHEPIEDIRNWQRVTKANQHYAISMKNKENRNKKYLWLSFHSNAFSNSFIGQSTQARGLEVWTSRGNTQSDKIASLWLAELEKELKPFKIGFRIDLTDGDGDKEANFEELVGTAMPAVLVENLFFTNIDDWNLLNNADYQTAFTKATIEMLLKWNETK